MASPDQYIFAALYSTISTAILPYVLNLDTTVEIWNTLHTRLQSSNRSRLLQLKNELYHLSLKNNSMTNLSQVKTLVNQNIATGHKLDTKDVILHVLNSLPTSYQSFKISIRTHPDTLTLDELYSLLISKEIYPTGEATVTSMQHKQHSISQEATITGATVAETVTLLCPATTQLHTPTPFLYVKSAIKSVTRHQIAGIVPILPFPHQPNHPLVQPLSPTMPRLPQTGS